MNNQIPRRDRRLFGGSVTEVHAAFQDWEEVACPVCQIPPKPFAKDPQGFQLCRCPACGLEFLNPRPVLSELVEHVYNDTYAPGSSSDGLLSPVTAFQFRRQVECADGLLGAANKQTKDLLDVGCGDGTFLRFAKERGWSVAGCDVWLTPAARAGNWPLWEGVLESIDFGGRQFDLVRFNHVLEHTQNPLPEILRSRQLLRPGGVLYLSVPNLAGLSPRLKSIQSLLHLKRHRWRHYAALHHLWFFTPKTLRRVLEHAGFRVLRWETPLYKRPGRNFVVDSAYRVLLEKTASSSILDFYATPATQ